MLPVMAELLFGHGSNAKADLLFKMEKDCDWRFAQISRRDFVFTRHSMRIRLRPFDFGFIHAICPVVRVMCFIISWTVFLITLVYV